MHGRKLVVSTNSTWNFVNFRSGLLKALVDDGYDVVALAPDDGFADDLGGLGCRYVPLPMQRRATSVLGDLRVLRRYRAALRAEQPDAYLSFTIKPNIYGSLAARSLGIPQLINVAGLGTTFQSDGLLNRLVRVMYGAALKRSSVTFFQNPDDLELFVQGGLVDRRRTRLLPGSGVDLVRFAPVEVGRNHHRSGPVFLLLARLLWAKGIAEYAEAARAIRKRHPGAEFRLLGMMETRADAVPADVIRQWDAEGVLQYLGQTQDVRSAIADADCVVLPTFYPEGTPRSLLESIAMGKPIVTTDMPGCREVVQDGVNGFLCRPRDSASLAYALTRFIDLVPEEREKMGVASRKLAQTRFDEKIVISAYREALTRILA